VQIFIPHYAWKEVFFEEKFDNKAQKFFVIVLTHKK
jgi:hypothetical protein